MSDTEAIASNTPELTQEEREAANSKRKVQRERHTLFVGNLPFGKLCFMIMHFLIRTHIFFSQCSRMWISLPSHHSETSDTDIKAMFEPHGKVELVNIPRDKITQKPRGFAFVDMGSAEALQAAIAAVDGSTFENRQIRVSRSVPKGEVEKFKKPEVDKFKRSPSAPSSVKEAPGGKKIYVGNIPFTASKEDIADFYTEFGEVIDVYIPQNPSTGEGRGFAFVTMKEEDVNNAIEGTNGADFGGRTLVVNEPLPPGKKAANRRADRTKLYVGNLSFYTVPETLEALFGEFGQVVDCYLPEDPSTGGTRGFGFVTMATDDALRAIAQIDGCEVDGRVIRVNEAQPKGSPGRDRHNDMDDEELGVISGSWDDMDQ